MLGLHDRTRMQSYIGAADGVGWVPLASWVAWQWQRLSKTTRVGRCRRGARGAGRWSESETQHTLGFVASACACNFLQDCKKLQVSSRMNFNETCNFYRARPRANKSLRSRLPCTAYASQPRPARRRPFTRVNALIRSSARRSPRQRHGGRQSRTQLTETITHTHGHG
jgi:hypothetical protein